MSVWRSNSFFPLLAFTQHALPNHIQTRSSQLIKIMANWFQPSDFEKCPNSCEWPCLLTHQCVAFKANIFQLSRLQTCFFYFTHQTHEFRHKYANCCLSSDSLTVNAAAISNLNSRCRAHIILIIVHPFHFTPRFRLLWKQHREHTYLTIQRDTIICAWASVKYKCATAAECWTPRTL